MKDFPVNVFPDVERNAFKKFSKKNVTEDYIKENLKRKGWECYKPFTDTGLDLLATKIVNGERIYRYIQIKTRALVNNFFGYTLTSKDFVTDPRKFYFFYCDTMDDVIILSTYEYLKIFYDNKEMGITHFANPAFRNNNNKLNSLRYSNGKWTWSYRSATEGNKIFDFTPYVNDNGLLKMESTDIEKNFSTLLDEITKMKYEMFYKLNKTPSNKSLFEDQINTGQQINSDLNNLINLSSEDYMTRIIATKNDFKTKYPDLYLSHCNYVIDEMTRGDDDD